MRVSAGRPVSERAVARRGRGRVPRYSEVDEEVPGALLDRSMLRGCSCDTPMWVHESARCAGFRLA